MKPSGGRMALLAKLRSTFHVVAVTTPLVVSLGSALAEDSPPQCGEPRPADDRSSPYVGGPSQSSFLSGDWNGLRTRLADCGLTLRATYTADALGVVSGGLRRGGTYEGRLELQLDYVLTTDWSNITAHASGEQIHGRELSANYLGNNILTASGNEAKRATRLFTLWLQAQKQDAYSFRIGQLAADDEFVISATAANFVNSTFGWPGLMASDLPSGGPAYPLATPGARLSIGPSDGVSVLAAVFNGDPAGPGTGTPQSRDPGGTAFRLNDGAFAIAEVTYGLNQRDDDKGLTAAYRLGGWYHSGRFADERFDAAGRSLADPASTHVPVQHRGNYGVYAVADQMLSENFGAFVRVAASPSDRNLVGFYADAGVTYTRQFDEKDKDKDKELYGLAFAYAGISDAASALDRDARDFSGIDRPVRDHEMALELTYIRKIRWLTVQPDLQFIFHPGGHVPPPNDPAVMRAIRDAVIVGVRTGIAF